MTSANIAQMSNKQDKHELLEGLLPDQEKVVTTLDKPLFVAAGAGSGKTFTLTRRIVWALTKGSASDGGAYLDSLDQALIITYTNKAAAEIRERVRKALRAAGLTGEALKVDSAWISTIHGMCGRILRENALDLGLDPDFTLLPPEEADALRTNAISEAIRELDDEPYLSELFASYGVPREQSGDFKTDDVATLVNKIMSEAGFVEGGLSSVSFYDKTSDFNACIAEFASDLEDLLTFDCTDSHEKTVWQEHLQELRAYLVLSHSEQTLEAADKLLKTMPEFTKNYYWVYFPLESGASKRKQNPEAKESFSAAKASYTAMQAALAYYKACELQGPLMRLVHAVNERLEAYKTSQSYLDNADLLQRTAKAFAEHPEIAERYTHKFKLVMVDEFQDTNMQQVQMIKALAGQNASHLTTVGDVQQSIYRFQGADPNVFVERGKEVDVATTVRLDTNFRSDDAILRFVARCCGNTGLVANFADLQECEDRKNGFKNIDHPRVIVELTRSWSEADKNLKKWTADSKLRTRLQAEQLANRLATLRSKGVEPSRMVVLMSSLGSSAPYIEALRKYGIESIFAGGSTFAKQPEVLCIKALMHTLANPQDTDMGLYPLLSSPMFELDASDMAFLASKNQIYKNKETGEETPTEVPAKRGINIGMFLNEPLYSGHKGSARLSRARTVINAAWQRLGKLPVADILLMCVRESGWLARLEAQGVTGHAQAANVLAAIRYIRGLSEPQARDVILATQAFDAWLIESKEHPVTLAGGNPNAVKFMTVHASKGLEFDVVAVVGCCGNIKKAPKILTQRTGDAVKVSLAPPGSLDAEGQDSTDLPGADATALAWRQYLVEQFKEAEKAEKARLLYVALTRAKECVVLCLDEHVRTGGKGIVPEMSGAITAELGIDQLGVGEGTFAYGAREEGLVRIVELARQFDGNAHKVMGADTLKGVPDVLYAEPDAVEQPAQATEVPASTDTSFEIFNIDAETRAPLGSWSVRTDLFGAFSYSSTKHVLAQQNEGLALDDVLNLPDAAEASASELSKQDKLPCDIYFSESDTLPDASQETSDMPSDKAVLQDESDSEEIEASAQDADRATNLGTSFHELARYMVETGCVPSAETIARVAKTSNVLSADTVRLTDALKRWETSAIRAEVMAFGQLHAEVAFCCDVTSPLGSKLDGAIDLLATNPADPTAAMLIDYKTGDHGLTYAQIRQSHEMQARFYAYVLQQQGFTHITCAFVCVELEDNQGEPVVIRYEFN